MVFGPVRSNGTYCLQETLKTESSRFRHRQTRRIDRLDHIIEFVPNHFHRVGGPLVLYDMMMPTRPLAILIFVFLPALQNRGDPDRKNQCDQKSV